MKVALVTTDLGLTGIPRYVEILAAALVKLSNLQVAVIALQPPLDRGQTLEAAGIPVRVLSPHGAHFSRREFSRKLRGLLKDMQPDLMHTNLWSRGLVTSWVAYRLGIPVVVTWHYWMRKTHWSRNNLKKTLKEVVALLMQQLMGSHFIAIGDHVQRPGIMANRISRILSGIPPEPEINRDSKRPVIALQAAQLTPLKGQADFLRATAMLPIRKDLEVWLAGEGPSRPQLEIIAENLGLHNVHFLGWRSDVKDLMRRADLAVLPSYAEGFGLFVLESMMLGLPVVGYRIPALRTLVSQECGILVEPGDIAALSAALETLINNASLRHAMGAAAYQRAVEKFSDTVMAKKTLRVYEDLLHKRAGAFSSGKTA